MWGRAVFADRTDAGRRLAAALSAFASESPVVLALPRGGVPVGFEIAQALDAPLDVVLVRKVGVPGHEELALGAIVGGDPPVFVVNEDVAAVANLPSDTLERAKSRQLAEIDRRRRIYRGAFKEVSIAGRTIIVVDDGIATGATMRASLRALRARGAGRLVVAVPVAPYETIKTLDSECDAVVCLETPEPFGAVGAHYADFSPVEEDTVVALLERARKPNES